jgi:glutamate dehydrogenase
MDLLEEKGFIPVELIESEANWFYDSLGIDDQYFQTESVEVIASNVLSLFAGKVAAFSREDGSPEIKLDKEQTDHAVYIDTSRPGISVTDGPRYEQRIDTKYLNGSTSDRAYRLESFRASNVGDDKKMSLRCYFVYLCDFANPNPTPGETRLDLVGEKRFLQKATKNTKEIYQEILDQVVLRTGPVIEYFDIEGSDEKRLVVAYKQGTALGFFSALSDLYHWYGMTSTRKYVEHFSNGYTVMSLYLKPVLDHPRHMPTSQAIRQIVKEVSLLYCIPQNKFQHHFIAGKCNLQETIYAHCVWVFVTHFLNRLGSEYHSLAEILDPSNSAHLELLSKLKKRLRSETFTTDYIREIINQYPDLIHALYLKFAKGHYPEIPSINDDFLPTLSYLRLKVDRILTDEEIKQTIEETVVNEHHLVVMRSFHIFNKAVL